MHDTTQKLIAIREKRKRWNSRLTRATNMLGKLHRQEQRLLKPVPKKPATKPEQPKPIVTEETALPELDIYFQDAARQVDQKAVDDLDIPPELKRTEKQPPKVKGCAGDPGPKMLEDLLNPAAVMNRKRLAKLDAKRRGYRLPKVDKKAMPLSGREALKAIKKK